MLTTSKQPLPPILDFPAPKRVNTSEQQQQQEDLPEDTNWVHFRVLERQQKKREQQSHSNTMFPHSNDRDFMSIQYINDVKIMPVFNDGSQFTLFNALNHPDRLLNSLDGDQKTEKKQQPSAAEDTKEFVDSHSDKMATIKELTAALNRLGKRIVGDLYEKERTIDEVDLKRIHKLVADQ